MPYPQLRQIDTPAEPFPFIFMLLQMICLGACPAATGAEMPKSTIIDEMLKHHPFSSGFQPVQPMGEVADVDSVATVASDSDDFEPCG